MHKYLIAFTALTLMTSTAYADPGKGKGNSEAKHEKKSHGKANGGHDYKSKSGKHHAKGSDYKGHAKYQGHHGKDKGAKVKYDDKGKHAKFKYDKHDYKHGKDWKKSAKAVHKVRDDWPEWHGTSRRIVRKHHGGRTLVQGCPPGLAKKFNGCMPPGLAKKQYGYSHTAYYRPDWWGYSHLSSGRYFYRDGYLLRLGGDNRISAYVPLLAGALGIGKVWPSYYQPQSLASYHIRYFDLGAADSYRYADRVVYRLDPKTAAITSVAALLTGDSFKVGQPMPSGYGVYNVPYAYRDRYVDTADAHYRYADGYIYEIDPKTALIASAISLVT